MKRTDEYTVVSDSGHTCIIHNPGAKYPVLWGVMQHSIAKGSLSAEDMRMTTNPEKFWRENKIDDLPITR